MRFLKPKHCALALTLISHVMPLSPVAEQVDSVIGIHASTNNEESSPTALKGDEGEASSLEDQVATSGALHEVFSDDLEKDVEKLRENPPTPLGEESTATAADVGGDLMRKALQNNLQQADIESSGDDGAAKNTQASDYIKDDEMQNESTPELAVDNGTVEVSKEIKRESTREAGPEDELVSEDDTGRIHSSGTRRADIDDTTESLSLEPSATSKEGDPKVDNTPGAAGGVAASTAASCVGIADTEEDDEDDEDEDIPVKAVNYAHKNAGAIILFSSPTFKGTSNLLVSDNDKYAISPCSDKKSVVISLSEDILVKVIVLSNFEKYSSSVKEFQVLGTQHYDPGNSKTKWHDLGKYTAKPTSSGEETFELKEATWARYLKFRFVAHYGNEHYCTITQIKVHGSTMVQGFHEQYDPWPGVEAELEDVYAAEIETDSETVAEGTEEEKDASPVDEEPVEGTCKQTTETSADAESVISPEASETEKVPSSDGAVKTGAKVAANQENSMATKESAPESEGAATDQIGDKETTSSRLDKSEQIDSACIRKGEETVHEENKEGVEKSENGPGAKVTEAVQSVTSMLNTVSAMVAASNENATTNGAVSPSKNSSEATASSREEGTIDIQEGKETEVDQKGNHLNEDEKSSKPTSDQNNAADKGSVEPDQEQKQATNGNGAKVLGKNKPSDPATKSKATILKDETPKQTKSSPLKVEQKETHHDMEKLNNMLKVLADTIPSVSCIENLKFSDFRVKLQNKAKAARDATAGSAPNMKMEPIFKTLTDEIKGLQIHVSMYDQFLNELTVCYHQVVVHLASQNQRMETEHNLRLAQIDERLRKMEHPERLKFVITAVESLRPGALTAIDVLQRGWTTSYAFVATEVIPVIRQNLETNETYRDAALLASGAFLALLLIFLWRLVSNWRCGKKHNETDIVLPPHPGRKVRKKKRKTNGAAIRHNQVTSDESNS